ncbi:putative membrane protein [Lyngbya aestuarii BL J]|uniref:Putative membrane protein n=1 Tax=Lyngbya aestuarii BL J TaxID=1348334 RepID=U7QQG5_9CYAN|nr:putative membrane protein [Lyngbya aestuarii]ERT09355.1 putative membrane protein [Lyngbya aestuarii BL J]
MSSQSDLKSSMSVSKQSFKQFPHWIYSLLIVSLIVSCGVFAYSSVFNDFFLSDDFVLIALFSELGPWGLWVNQQHGQSLFFRPVLSLISFIDYQVWGLNPFGYHLTNFLLHLMNSLWVGLIAFFLGKYLKFQSRDQRLIPYLAALIFLLLPCHTEVVSWISARTDGVATFFGLLSFVFYLSYKYYFPPRLLIFSALSFFAALLSKESVVTYPGLIILFELYEYFILQNNRNTLAGRFSICSLYIWVLIIYFCSRFLKLGELVGGYGEEVHLSFDLDRILQNLVIYPTRTFVTPRLESDFTFWFIAFLGLVVLFLFSLIVCWKRRPQFSEVPPILVFLIGSFFTLVLPAITVSVSMIDTQGERYLYFASGFAAIFLAIILIVILQNLALILIVSSAILLYFGTSVYDLNQNWNTAAKISEDLLVSLQEIPKSQVIINSLPDNYHGAYIYRTGLIQGLYLFDPSNQFEIEFHRKKFNPAFENVKFTTNNIQIVMNHSLVEANDSILVNNPEVGVYQFQLYNPLASFYAWNKNDLETESYQVTNLEYHQYELRFIDLTRVEDLVFYSSGKLVDQL